MSLFDLAQLRSPPSPERFRSAATREEVVLTQRDAGDGDGGGNAESYQIELHRLLEKSKGTPYEMTLRKFVEAKEATPDGSGWQQHSYEDGSPQKHWSPVHSASSSGSPRGGGGSPRGGGGSPRGGSPPKDLQMAQQANSPTRSKARADVEAILVAREERAQRASLTLEQENVHKTRHNFSKSEDWLNRISTPKKTQTRAYEVQHRLKNRVMRNSTNHIGRQRQNPIKDDDGAAFSPFGVVNLSTKTGGVAASDNAVLFKSSTNDKRKNVHYAGSHLALKDKKISEQSMQAWIEENARWRASLDAKKQSLANKHHGHSFTPRVSTDSEAHQLMVDAALKRESKQLRQALKEEQRNGHRPANVAIVHSAPTDVNSETLPVAPSSTARSSGLPPMPPTADYGTTRFPTNHKPFGESPASVLDSADELISPERRKSASLELFGRIDEEGVQDSEVVLPPPPAEAPPDMTDTPGTAGSSPGIVDLDFSQTDKSMEERFAREEWEYQQAQEEQQRQQQQGASPRGRSMERGGDTPPVSHTHTRHHHHRHSPSPRTSRSASPNVFDRMCVRIAAHTIAARKPYEPVIGTDNEEQCTFAPVINQISSKMVERRNAREHTRHQNISVRARSASPSTDRHSTSQRRGSFFGLYKPSAGGSPGSSDGEFEARTDADAEAKGRSMSPSVRRAKELLRNSRPAGIGFPGQETSGKASGGANLGNIFTSPTSSSAAAARPKSASARKPIGRTRSESPARPIFGVRSVNLNYILPTDSISQGLKWAAKQEIQKQREIERRRSPSPNNRYTSPVHNAIVQEQKRKERKKSHWRNATDFMKKGESSQSISVTERLNRFYAAREQEKNHQSSFERARRGSVASGSRTGNPQDFDGDEETKSPAPFQRIKYSHEHQYNIPHKPAVGFNEASGKVQDVESAIQDMEAKKRRESKTWNDHIFAKSAQKNKNFMERTSESVEDFNVRRGVSDLLILKGVAPSPCTYVVPTSTVEKFAASNYRKNLSQKHIMKNDNTQEGLGNAENGRSGYTFAKKQRQFAQYGHVKIQGLAHKLLAKVFAVTHPTGVTELPPSPPSPAAAAGEEVKVSPKVAPSRRQSVARFDRFGNMN